jgi:dihydrofolate synthase/folylpolyglutamate synthase
MTSYSAALAYLYGLQYRGMKFGLRNIRLLVKAAGHPERGFPSIHIAGTNGKGSTAAFLASICMESGLKTGLYTSPHLVRFTERIRINGNEIPEKLLAGYVERLKPHIESAGATFFEATTCIAFMFFADQKVDIAILETGLGGRLDATNIVRPLLSVLTSISIDHTDYLGRTIRSIAREKAGIIKRSVPCITSSTDPTVLAILRKSARRRNVTMREARRLATMELKSADCGNPVVAFRTAQFTVNSVRLGLPGIHQVSNARLAVGAMELLRKRRDAGDLRTRVTARTIARGLAHARRNTGLRGRLEGVETSARYILDVAHNPSGMKTLVQALSSLHIRNLVAVVGVMKDKAYIPMLDELVRIAAFVVPVAPHLPRALSPRVLERTCVSRGIPVERGFSVKKGLERAEKLAGHSGRILITGSHYVVGEAIHHLGKRRA